MPVATIASVVMVSTWVESGTAIPIAAKKNNRGVRPRNVAQRYRRTGYPAMGARNRTAQYGRGLQEQSQTQKKGLRSKSVTVRRTRADRRAGSKRGCANAAW